ncbi:MAG: 1-(5-phosphoribosyl)-5-[(5-phosphoribosylamino)methylideneamino]imidazole-4-carboxamide isomerase [Planctomycetota bacterium]
MEIWPAIDLLGGRCVRLQQGDYNRDTVFSDNPAATAEHWFSQGAERLHCVDLDGARGGAVVNESAIRAIVNAASGRPVQLGGGVRSEETIERLFGLGVSRLVAGTAALKNPDWFAAMCQKYPGRLVLGVDARDGMVATQGWLETSQTPAIDLIADIARRTTLCAAVVYTDIARDGMLEGPNFEGLDEVRRASPIPVIASGGITTYEDVRELARRQTHGAIIGRALYEGRIELPGVLQASSIS